MPSNVQEQKLNHLFQVWDRDRNGVLEEADFDRVSRDLAAIRGHAAGSPEHAAIRARYAAWTQAAAPYHAGRADDDGRPPAPHGHAVSAGRGMGIRRSTPHSANAPTRSAR